MKILLISILAITCVIARAADPAVTIELGKLSPNKVMGGILDYPAKITNHSKKSVWVYSMMGDSTKLYYGASTRTKPSAKWESLPYGMCGVGAMAIELKPGSSFAFRTSAPTNDAGLEYRVEVNVLTGLEEDSESIEVKSPAVVIPKAEAAPFIR